MKRTKPNTRLELRSNPALPNPVFSVNEKDRVFALATKFPVKPVRRGNDIYVRIGARTIRRSVIRNILGVKVVASLDQDGCLAQMDFYGIGQKALTPPRTAGPEHSDAPLQTPLPGPPSGSQSTDTAPVPTR